MWGLQLNYLRGQPVPVTMVMTGQDCQAFERALAETRDELSSAARRGQCLERICGVYIQGTSSAGRSPNARQRAWQERQDPE